MLKKIKDLLLPFASIAEEMRIIRELYEMELAAMNPPLIRVTGSPSEGDTEVTYSGVEKKPQSKAHRLLATLTGEEEEE